MDDMGVFGGKVRQLCTDVIGFSWILEDGPMEPIQQLRVEAEFTRASIQLALTIMKAMERL